MSSFFKKVGGSSSTGAHSSQSGGEQASPLPPRCTHKVCLRGRGDQRFRVALPQVFSHLLFLLGLRAMVGQGDTASHRRVGCLRIHHEGECCFHHRVYRRRTLRQTPRVCSLPVCASTTIANTTATNPTAAFIGLLIHPLASVLCNLTGSPPWCFISLFPSLSRNIRLILSYASLFIHSLRFFGINVASPHFRYGVQNK